jgi:hypothetical protein
VLFGRDQKGSKSAPKADLAWGWRGLMLVRNMRSSHDDLTRDCQSLKDGPHVLQHPTSRHDLRRPAHPSSQEYAGARCWMHKQMVHVVV